ncbi:hypothetical protein B0T13DRAFT_508308 [Neurospora crassa]|nr:hypothetical protein B0T13DRAFT_508308 [Neurospora crassa]
MASLKFIMDVNDDHTESHHINKKDVASDHPVNMGHPHRPPLHTQLPSLPPTTLPPITLPRYDSNPGSSIQPRDISLAVASSQTKSPDISWESKGVNPVVSSIPLAVHIRSTMRRRNTASNDSADHTTGFGPASTSSTGGNYPQSHTPLRPMRSQSHTSELPMRLTPITGRTFTRAEHLRRHQLGHGPPDRDMSKKAIKCFKLYQVTTSMTILVHPLHRLALYRRGRAKGHLAGYHQVLPILAEEYYAMIQYQECSQSQIMSEPKIHITTPLGLNTTRLYRPQTSIGRLNRLGYSRYNREWKHPFRTYLRQSPGVILLRRRPPQATQQLQYLENMFARHLANSPSYNSGSQSRTYNHLIVPPRASEASSPQGSYHQHQRVLPATALPSHLDTRIQKEALLDSSYDMQGAPFPLEDIGMFDAMRAGLEGSADPSYSSDDVGYENGNLVTLGLPISNGCEFTGATLPKLLMNPLHGAIPRYLAVYWEKVHTLLPIVHRASFENAPEEVLRYAMAAMATQFLDDEEDRVKGSRLHDLAWRETLQWNIQVMQAIFLCEYFARLRGQNVVIRPSRLFEDLYKRPQLEVSEQTYSRGAFNPQVLYHHPTMIDYSASPSDQQLSIQASWKNWVDVEAHRRLLAACFFLDGHVAIYQQQPQLGQSSVASKLIHPPIPLMGSSLRLWEATSAAPWAKILAEDPSVGIPVFAPSPGTITPDFVSRQISIDRMIILVAEYLRMPCRQGLTASSASAQKSSVSEVDPQLHYMNSQFSPLQQESPCFQPDFLQPSDSRTRGSLNIEARLGSLFPGCPIASTYLALHHTPLRDLLAVSGESWLFTKKVLPAAAFGIHQRCLKAWAENYHYRQGGDANVATDMANLSVVKAIKYAARSIVQFLSPVSPGVSRYAPVKGAATEDRSSFWGKDISDYWALYVCALIFWAFGHRARSIPTISSTIAAATDVQQQQQQQQQPSAKRQRTGDIRASLTSRHGSSAVADQRAMSWLRMLGADNVTEEDIIRARSRSESMSVVSLVRRRLEVDCIGGKNMLYVEAVAVLRRLEEDGERNDKPWF